jgi:ferric-dicitrate binding protein FerR (iron transport regulator)
MSDNHHRQAPPHRAQAPLPPQRRRRLLRWVLVALVAAFCVAMAIAVLQVLAG